MIKLPNSDRDGILGDLMPDLTPLLDVMFMLIVFLILTANAVPFAVDVELPDDKNSVSSAVDEQRLIRLTLLPDEQGWKLDDNTFNNEEAMQAALVKTYQADKQKRVIIMGEKSVSMQKLLNVITFLRTQNIQAADIVVNRP